ncbi:MAG: endonuclease VII domain-containing protein [Armatimonadia bacterium]
MISRTPAKTDEERRERKAAAGRRYRETHAEHIRAYRETHRAEASASGRRHNLKRFGLTVEDYDRIHAAQAGLCACCGKPETSVVKGTRSRLRVDHNHATGAVRELLCNDCNLRIGRLLEDKEWTMHALDYLARHGVTLKNDEAPKGIEGHKGDEEQK